MEHFACGIELEASGGFPVTTDTLLLADFVRLRADEEVCDLGCGSGALGLLLCGRDAACRVTGVELEADACAAAVRNIARNSLADRFALIPGDLREIRTLLPQHRFTHVVSNPPYFPATVPAAPEARRAAARSEQTCTLEQLCAAAAWLLKDGGRFSLVYRPERLCDLFCTLRARRLEPKRLRLVRHRPDAAASLALLEARAGGGAGLDCGPELVLSDRQGRPSAEFRRIYHLEGGA
ncbi:MAG: methyltransferase [Oscillospiraceae bacterium]|nr:methyltransferase [Oscillospiraceae bacterium]